MLKSTKNLFLITVLILSFASLSFAADRMPAEKAGTIAAPTGQIAFARGGNIWIMNADGTGQTLISSVANADGRISWSPDNKTLVFTRSGLVDLKAPDFMGGKHKVYDLFFAYIDSAKSRTDYWYRLTFDVGSRDPEWSADGKTIWFWKDMNANQVNAFKPNYQICSIEPDGSNLEIYRKDWQNFYEDFMSYPTVKANGDLAFVYFSKERKIGFVTMKAAEKMMSMDSLKVRAEENISMVSPSWSPDGNWLAVVSNSMDDAGLYIYSADMKEKYLVTAAPVGTYLTNFTPSFSPDGKWLTFCTTDGSIWIVDVTGNGLRRLTGPGANDKAPAWSN